MKRQQKKQHRATTKRSTPASQLSQARAIESRRQILLVSADLFHARGYDATTLRLIAQKLNMGLSSLYYHFSSKDEILEEVLRLGLAGLESAVADAVASLPTTATPILRVQRAIEAAANGILVEDEVTAFIRAYNRLPRHLTRRDHPLRKSYLHHWHTMLRAAKLTGDIENNFPVEIFVEFVHGAFSRMLEWYEPAVHTPEEIGKLISHWVLHGVASAKAMSARSRRRRPPPTAGKQIHAFSRAK